MVLVETSVKASDQIGPSRSGVLNKPGSLRDGGAGTRCCCNTEQLGLNHCNHFTLLIADPGLHVLTFGDCSGPFQGLFEAE